MKDPAEQAMAEQRSTEAKMHGPRGTSEGCRRNRVPAWFARRVIFSIAMLASLLLAATVDLALASERYVFSVKLDGDPEVGCIVTTPDGACAGGVGLRDDARAVPGGQRRRLREVSLRGLSLEGVGITRPRRCEPESTPPSTR